MLKPENIFIGEPGEMALLLGNEAIARGIIEAGVEIATTYPGTPSSEVGDTISKFYRGDRLYFQYSVNEKVAFEIAYASSLSGKRSFTFMKVVGMNVLADSLMTSAYTGVNAGLVVMTADDPSMFSSQNEQDNRHYSDLAHIPLIEPASPQEAKDLLSTAFELSESEHIPVLFRTTTRISHQRAPVTLGHIKERHTNGLFQRDIPQYLPFQPYSARMKRELIEKNHRIASGAEGFGLNRIVREGSGEFGIIVSGAAYGPLMDVVEENDLDASVLKLGLVNPLSTEQISGFMERNRTVAVVEELDPFVESKVRSIAQMKGIPAKIVGKLDGIFPESFEYTQKVIAASLGKVTAVRVETPAEAEKLDVPPRPPVMCAGCPHRGTFYAVRKAVRMAGIKDAVFPSDIGCYSLGIFQPYELSDTLLSMGSSVGVAQGFAQSTDQPVIAFIGDSTFFHAGMPPLVNAVHNNSNIILVILDNAVTAMTGQQANPGSPFDSFGNPANPVDIEKIVRAAGVGNVSVVDPFDIRETMKAVGQALHHEGVSVIIARRECAVFTDHRKKVENVEIVPYQVDAQKCTSCMNCIENFSCPAMSVESGRVSIDSSICNGCGLCAEVYVCPFRAIEQVKA